MKIILLVLSLIIAIIGCKTTIIDDKLNDKLFIFFKESLKGIDSTHILDSIRVLNIDTVSKKDVIYTKALSMYDQADLDRDQIHLLEREIKSNLQIAKLYAGLSNTLKNNYVEEARDKRISGTCQKRFFTQGKRGFFRRNRQVCR